VLDFGFQSPFGDTSNGTHVPKRHSVHSSPKNAAIARGSGHHEPFDSRNFESKRSKARGTRNDAVNPVVFVQKWAKTSLPRDASTAQLTKTLAEVNIKTYHEYKFVPESKLREIVTAEVVQNELQKSNYSNLRRMKTRPITVTDGSAYQKILTILYLIKQPSKIRMFVKHGICDQDLPLVKCPILNKNRSLPGLKSAKKPAAVPIKFKRRDYTEEFFENQWRVLAPCFAGSNESGVQHSRLEPQSILPFVSHTKISRQGGFSDVYRTEIYPDHHQLSSVGVSYLSFTQLSRIILILESTRKTSLPSKH
jgi:hypothetical protein